MGDDGDDGDEGSPCKRMANSGSRTAEELKNGMTSLTDPISDSTVMFIDALVTLSSRTHLRTLTRSCMFGFREEFTRSDTDDKSSSSIEMEVFDWLSTSLRKCVSMR